MYKYEVRFKYNTDANGNGVAKTVQITLPKRFNALTDAYGSDQKGQNEILIKAVNELRLDPNMVEAMWDRTKIYGGMYELKYLGEEGAATNNKSKKEEKSKSAKSIFVPLWAFPFKLIWRIIKGILFFWMR